MPRIVPIAVIAMWSVTAGQHALAQAAQQAAAAPDALTTLLPHQKGKSLCYASRGAPVTFPLEDIPARKQPRKLAVKRFLFLLTSNTFPDDDSTTPPAPGKPYYGYRLVAEVVGRKARLRAAGECLSQDPTGFGCGVECDGGSMSFDREAGSDTLLMRVSDGSRRFRMTWGCSEDDEGRAEVLRDDARTPSVRMEPAEIKACRAIARWFRD
jgi:hypothetical protein